MKLLTDGINRQLDTSAMVLENLDQEVRNAVANERQNKISDAASMFGISTGDMSFLRYESKKYTCAKTQSLTLFIYFRGSLTPTLPKIFKELDLSSETILSTMEIGKRMKLMAAAEVLNMAQKQLKDERWGRSKGSEYKEIGYQTPYGKYSE